MIGTHDSMTYLPARWRVFELVSFLWRTQYKTLSEQECVGARYFDIRVRWTRQGWQVCHGLVDLRMRFGSLDEIMEMFSPHLVRLILERGDTATFLAEISGVASLYPNLSYACIKRGWKVLVNRDPVIKDYCFTPWLSGLSFWDNVKRLWSLRREPKTIKGWARKHRPKLDEDEETVRFVDYL